MSTSEFETRLQEHIKSLVAAHLSNFQKEVNGLQQTVEQLVKSSFGRVMEAANQGLEGLPTDDGLLQLVQEMANRAKQALAQQKAETESSTNLSLLKVSINEIQSHKTQADVLTALVSQASSFAPRVALFIVKSGNAVGWMARGFDNDQGNEALRGQAISLQSDTVLRAVLSKQHTFSGDPNTQPENHLLFERFNNSVPARVSGIPLLVRGKAAAVLYADSGTLLGESINLDALEILVNIAGVTIELISVRPRSSSEPVREGTQALPSPPPQMAPPEPVKATAPPLPTPKPAPMPEPPVKEASLAPPPRSVAPPPLIAPEPMRAPEVAPAAPIQVTASYPNMLTSEPQPAAAIPSMAEPVSPFAEAKPSFAEEIEVMPPSKPAPPPPIIPSFAPEPAPTPAPQPVQMPKAQPQSAPAPANEEEQKLHNDARRFARLLVSEIKLYNEQKVLDGRKNFDLYDRLKEDIDRSRQMYDKRVSALVAAKFDYFYDELVNTLAEGDTAKLGRDCPGPSVQVS